MKKKIISIMHNDIGNQMFIYASSFAISKKLNRLLLVDDETEFLKKNNDPNKPNYSKFSLNCFNISAKIAKDSLKFKGFFGYIKYKILFFFDFFKQNKSLITELRDSKKISSFQSNIGENNNKNTIHLKGHFETEKYFANYKKDILNEFTFKKQNLYINNHFYNDIKKTNSLSICIRRDRFSEKRKNFSVNDDYLSELFVKEQLLYINNALIDFNSKIANYKIFLWSNNYQNIENYFPDQKINIVKTNDEALDLFLMSQCKFFITTPSTFNWWGAWLSNYENKIVYRPKNDRFSYYYSNNKNFWPESWISI